MTCNGVKTLKKRNLDIKIRRMSFRTPVRVKTREEVSATNQRVARFNPNARFAFRNTDNGMSKMALTLCKSLVMRREEKKSITQQSGL